MTDPKTLLALEHRVWQTVIQKDATALAAVFSDDYVEVTADGKRVLKDSIVKNSPLVDEIESYEIAQPTVIELGNTAAILSYHLSLTGRLRGEPITRRCRWVASVWRRTTEQWRCCFFQQTTAGSSEAY